jgi:hypothetical protein
MNGTYESFEVFNYKLDDIFGNAAVCPKLAGTGEWVSSSQGGMMKLLHVIFLDHIITIYIN